MTQARDWLKQGLAEEPVHLLRSIALHLTCNDNDRGGRTAACQLTDFYLAGVDSNPSHQSRTSSGVMSDVKFKATLTAAATVP
jgi:hypothetical protein